MEMEFSGLDTLMHYLDVNFKETWKRIGGGLENKLLRASFQYLRFRCDYSVYHQRIYAMLLGIFQNLILDTENAAWKILHQFIIDEALSGSGRKNAVWIALGLIGQLLDLPSHAQLVNDCIYMLVKNMTTDVPLGQISLNICYYEHLDGATTAKQAGIGLFALLGLNMSVFWPICCRQLQRLLDEEDGLLKAIKLLIGMLDFRHCGEFIKERTRQCDDLVANIVVRADRNMNQHVNCMRQAYMRDNEVDQK